MWTTRMYKNMYNMYLFMASYTQRYVYKALSKHG